MYKFNLINIFVCCLGIMFLVSCNLKSSLTKLSHNEEKSDITDSSDIKKYICELIIKTNTNISNANMPELKVKGVLEIDKQQQLKLSNDMGSFFSYEAIAQTIIDENNKSVIGLSLMIYGGFKTPIQNNQMKLFSKAEFVGSITKKVNLLYVNSQETIVLECIPKNNHTEESVEQSQKD